MYSDARITTKHTDIQCILTLNRVLITFVTKQESVAICCMTTGEEKQQCISGESLPHSYLCFVLWQNIFFLGGGGRERVLLVRIDLSKYDQGIIFFQDSRKPKFWSGATEPDVIRTIFFLINR